MTAVSREGAEAANLGGTKQLKVPTYPGALEGPLFGKPCRGIDRRFPFHVRPGSPPHSSVRFCGPPDSFFHSRNSWIYEVSASHHLTDSGPAPLRCIARHQNGSFHRMAAGQVHRSEIVHLGHVYCRPVSPAQ